MAWSTAARYVLPVLAAAALWLLLAGPDRLLGLDTGQVGMALLVATAGLSLHAVSRMPRAALADAASPAEWKAWIGAGFSAAALAYFLTHLHALGDAPYGPGARAVARNLVLLLVAWAVLGGVLAARWAGAVEEDERDRAIAARASGWGRGALAACVLGIAVMLGFSPAERLAWATPPMVANLLVFALMWGWLCGYAAACLLHRRDRRAAA